MTFDIILAGVGGQGVLSIAAIIAAAAMSDGLQVRQSEVHGMSQRGGAVQAHLRISDSIIASDLIPQGKADMILSMEPVESIRYLEWLKPDGIVITAEEPFINIPNYPEIERVYDHIRQLPRHKIVAAQEVAKQVGNPKSVNMVLIGSALSSIPINKKSIVSNISMRFGKKDPTIAEINIRALELGEKA